MAGAAKASADRPTLVYLGTYTGARSKGIYVSRFDSRTGGLSPPRLAAASANPSFLALHPDGRHLYAVNEVDDFGGERSGAASAFAIDAPTGRLRLLGQVSTRGAAPCHLSADRDGRFLFVANYGGGSVAVLPIRADGSLGEASAVVRHEGRGSNPERQERPHVHQVALDPSPGLLWAADLGNDWVLGYRYADATGALATPPVWIATLPAGSGPRHLAFAASGRTMFVLEELSLAVTSVRLDRASGAAIPVQTISSLPDGVAPSPGFKAAEIQVHPSGRFLYASNRGADSIAVFSIAADGDVLSRIEVVPSGGRTPRAFAIDPSGRWLLAANQDSDEVVVFRVDPATGRLSPSGSRARVGSPVSVLLVPPR